MEESQKECLDKCQEIQKTFLEGLKKFMESEKPSEISKFQKVLNEYNNAWDFLKEKNFRAINWEHLKEKLSDIEEKLENDVNSLN
ncbi:MAG: hypothetical protein M1542_08260 [Thermotogae bacterium]|jgi:hypothetical protein|nr:hypothetical protein [Thermotogota bacterium]MCL5033220.1 hypothetical protein [Thermotogota bacterium]